MSIKDNVNKFHRTHLIFLLCITLVIVCVYHPFFDLDRDISRVPLSPNEIATDLTPQFGPEAEVRRHYQIKYGEIPFWNPYVLSGVDFFSKPDAPFLSLETLLTFFFRGQVAVRLSILFHLVIGWFGLYLFSRTVGLSGKLSLLTGLIFFFSPTYMLYRIYAGHVNQIYGICIFPWLLYCTVKPFGSTHQRVILIGLLLGLMIHSGSPTIFLYTCLSGIPAYLLYRRRVLGGWKGGIIELFFILVIFFGCSLVKILPAMKFFEISARKFGISSQAAYHCETDVFVSESLWFLIPIGILFSLGSWLVAKKERLIVILIWLTMIFVFLYSFNYRFFDFCHEYIPFLDKQRCPTRSLFLVYFILSVVGAYGLAFITKIGRFRYRRFGSLVFILASAYFTTVFYFKSPDFPSMVDNKAIREKNPIIQYIRQDKSFYRFTSYHDNNRHWGYQHQTIPYGIRHAMGYISIWENDYLFSPFTQSAGKEQFPFIPLIYRNYGPMTGLLSIKYVSAMRPIKEDGLTLIKKFDVAPEPQPPKSRGPYLYKNEKWLPRAYMAGRTALLCGTGNWTKKLCLILLITKSFCPDQISLIYQRNNLIEADEALFGKVDYIISEKKSLIPEKYQSKVISPRDLIRVSNRKIHEVVPLQISENSPQHIKIEISSDLMNNWLILSEKFSLYPGWTAHLIGPDGKTEAPIFRANHINSAVWIPKGNFDEIVFQYTPPYFCLGILSLVTTLSVCTAMSIGSIIRKKRIGPTILQDVGKAESFQ